MRGALLAFASLVAAHAAGLPRACRQGDNYTAIPGCTPLANETVITDLTVAPGEYKHFHWAVGNYSDLDDASGNRRSITFEVLPCSGSAHLFVRSLAQPFPTSESHDFASTNDEKPNAVTLQLLRAHFFISVKGVASAGAGTSLANAAAEPIRFSIIAKISGGPRYPVPGADGALTVKNKFTESLLLPGDTMEMLVSFVPVPTVSSAFEYRVYTAPNATGAACSSGGGGCVKTTLCGVQRSMTPRTGWQAFEYSGTNVTVVAGGLAQNVEQIFVVVGRPVGGNTTLHPEQTVVYTATSGRPEYEKEAQLQDDQTILTTLGIVAGVLVLLFVVAYVARRQLITAFQSSSRKATRIDRAEAASIRRSLIGEEGMEGEGASAAGVSGPAGAKPAGQEGGASGDAKPASG